MTGKNSLKIFFILFINWMLLFNINSFGFSPKLKCQKQYYFKQFTTEEGLFRDNIDCIIQDKEGYIYACSQNGLHIFNGYSFKTINQDTHPKFSNKIFSCLDLEDRKILIGSFDKGIYIYDKVQEKIIHPKINHPTFNSSLSIRCLYRDTKNNIWIGCANGILLVTNTKELQSIKNDTTFNYKKIKINKNKIINSICQWNNDIYIGTNDSCLYKVSKFSQQYKLCSLGTFNRDHKQITSLHVNNHKLWVGTDSGIIILEKNKNNIPQKSKEFLKNKIIKAIDSNRPDNLWIATREKGLFNITLNNKKQDKVEHYYYDPLKKETINSNSLISLFIDRQNNLWIGTWFGGLNCTNLDPPVFQNIYNSSNENEIQKNTTWCIEPSSQGGYWIGTHANGLNYLKNYKNNFNTLLYNESMHSISSLLELKEKNILFVGTWGNGIKAYNKQNLTPLTKYNQKFDQLKNDRIYSIIKGNNNIIWIGTYYKGLYQFNFSSNTLKKIDIIPNLINNKNTDVRCLYKDNNTLWVGSIHDGLFKLTIDDNNQIIKNEHILPNNHHRSNLAVNSIIKNEDNIICTTENGLFKVTNNDSIYPYIPAMNGKLCTHAQYDNSNNLWISTYTGLYRYSENNNELASFFNNITFYKFLYPFSENEMVVCSNNGLLKFNPEAIFHNKTIPQITITGLKIFDKKITTNSTIKNHTILTKNPNYLDTLILPYFCNTFSFDVKILDLSSATDNKIMYKMEGIDTEWDSRDDSYATISYTNMPAGMYNFKVKAVGTNNSLVSQIKTLKIIKLKPWWASNIAYAIYFLFSIILFIIIINQIQSRIKLKNKLKIEKLNKEREEELNNEKLAFFTNISHELRTPLTLIVSPIEELINKSTLFPSLRPLLYIIHKNSLLLQRLINQILDFRKIEKASLDLHLYKINISDFIEGIICQFKETANKKKIEIEIDSEPETIWWPLDPYMFESIIYNLISNSLKFTEKYGKIFINITKQENSVTLKFHDTGIGIDETDIPKIFNRFYQGKQKGTYQGSGIGLALTQKYIEIQNGTIKVASKKNVGTLFTIEFKYPENKILNNLEVYTSDKHITINAINNKRQNNTAQLKKHNKTILITDDNIDILDYLKGLLNKEYTIITADNGKEALDLARRKNPDLIVSDIMMDGIDGYQLCKEIKQNLSTSHIPVILLTAKKGVEHRIKGIETGADAYIEKPFNTKLLVTQIAELIKHREKLKAKYTLIDGELKDITPSTIDEKFLREVIKIIEKYIHNPQLTVNTISSEMKISHDQLYRKIKSLSGLSANQFIRTTRLKKAINLLQQSNHSVSEIGYMVGFNSPSYFTKCFKDEFGMSPTEFVEKLMGDKF